VPERIQRKRTKGYRLPPTAVYVGRPSRWGNPYRVGDDGTAERCVELYRVSALGWWTTGWREHVRAELAGRDLACWCPLTDASGNRFPCHADVLLELANE
jgi:hypothetical protein